MPKPIPPPPPQPSQEETGAALRFLFFTLLVGALFFLAVSSAYSHDSLMVQYGRNGAQSWAVERTRTLDMEARRSHEGGQIVWLVGSSILRESFGEKELNESLESEGSKYRVIKLGMNRGASGVSAGLLRHIELQQGDLVIHSVSLENFREGWLKKVDLPTYKLMELLRPSDFWEIGEWGVQDKLEQASALPWAFYANHEAYTAGLTELWLSLTQWRRPEKSKPGYHWKYHRLMEKQRLFTGKANADYFEPSELDLSSSQFNVQGIEMFRRLCEEAKVDLRFIHIPPRQQFQAEVLHESNRYAFMRWLDGQEGITYFPQLKEEEFYDMKHPNADGRKKLSRHLIQWLPSMQKGTSAPLGWAIPEDRRAP
jgi:hypothetical protein